MRSLGDKLYTVCLHLLAHERQVLSVTGERRQFDLAADGSLRLAVAGVDGAVVHVHDEHTRLLAQEVCLVPVTLHIKQG